MTTVDDLLPRCRFPKPGTAVACAVSGGADSMAMLALAVAAGLQVTAVHVDHGLRPGSVDEGDVVAAAAARFGAACVRTSVDLAPGGNLEARARDARYAALPQGAMTGHTADDQAETVLLNLLRGAASGGLAAIRPGPTKPILALRRADTRALCATLDLAIVDDPSNDDLSFTRNRVRHQLLPLLGLIGGRDMVPLLVRQAEVARVDDDLLDQLASTLDPTDAKALAAAPVALARRAVRRWLHDGHPPDLATVDRVLCVARGDALACELPGGDRVSRHQQRLTRSASPGPVGGG